MRARGGHWGGMRGCRHSNAHHLSREQSFRVRRVPELSAVAEEPQPAKRETRCRQRRPDCRCWCNATASRPALPWRPAYPGSHQTRAFAQSGRRPAPRLYQRGPGVKPQLLRRDGAWLQEVSPDGMDAGGAPGRTAALGRAGGLVVVWSGAHVSIASSTSRTRCYRGSLRWRMSKKDCQAVRRIRAPSGAKGLNGWLRVSMYQIASVSLRASSIWATFAPRWRPRRRLVRW